MSKKAILAAIGVVLIVGAIVGGWLIFNDSSNMEQKNQSSSSEQQLEEQLDRACEVFTESDAQALLGSSASRDDRTDEEASNSEDIVVSKCVYVAGDALSASLVLRTPRNDAGKQTNQQVFNEAASVKGVEAVDGYGQKAFWNQEFGQLNILFNDEWAILEYGSLLPFERTLSETKKFADQIISKL